MKTFLKIGMLLCITALLACKKQEVDPLTTTTTTTSSTSSNLTVEENMETEILKLINAHRATLKLNALVMNEIIRKEARQHSQNMADGKTAFGHDGFSERTSRMRSQISGITATAENVAAGFSTAQTVVDGWLNSAGHRTNIEGNYTLSGIGTAKDAKGKLYFTHLFAKN
jgi:uncharacterized protein YkwD